MATTPQNGRNRSSPTEDSIQHASQLLPEKPSDSIESGQDTPDTAKTPDDLEPAPDGGLRAWSVAAGSASMMFCVLGFSNSSGVFQEYYLSHQLSDHKPDQIAWIGSIALYLQFAIGTFAGPMFDRFGSIIIRPAAVAYIFAVMMLSLCNHYWQIMLVQGVLMGVCMGFLQLPAMAAVSQWFDKKRAAALGLVVSGSSIGGIIFPVALSKLLNDSDVGFGWSVRIVGFIMAPFIACATFSIRTRVPSRKTNFWMLSAFKNTQFLFLVFSFSLALIGMFTPLFFIPTYAVSRGVDPALAGYLLAIINAASTFGRVIPGILADKLGRLNVVIFAGVSSGVLVFCMNSVTTTPGFIVYAIIFGFFSGSIFSASIAAVTSVTKDPREFGSYMGMAMALVAVGPLIGPPVDGALVARYGSFAQVSYFGGTVCTVGGLLALGAKMAREEGVWGKC